MLGSSPVDSRNLSSMPSVCSHSGSPSRTDVAADERTTLGLRLCACISPSRPSPRSHWPPFSHATSTDEYLVFERRTETEREREARGDLGF